VLNNSFSAFNIIYSPESLPKTTPFGTHSSRMILEFVKTCYLFPVWGFRGCRSCVPGIRSPFCHRGWLKRR
jgi:hypothetical protein